MFWILRVLHKSPPHLKKLQICAFQTFFGPFQTTYKPLPQMPKLLKRKPFQWYVLNVKNATQKPTWPQKALDLWFSGLFRPFSDHSKAATCLNLLLTCLDRSKRKPFQWYVLNLKNATQKPTWPQKASDLWFSDPFRSFSDHLTSNYLFKPLPHMSRPLQKKAISMICFESQECDPKAHRTSKSFRFVLFRPISALFRPPIIRLGLNCPKESHSNDMFWISRTQKPTWPQKALELWFSHLFQTT